MKSQPRDLQIAAIVLPTFVWSFEPVPVSPTAMKLTLFGAGPGVPELAPPPSGPAPPLDVVGEPVVVLVPDEPPELVPPGPPALLLEDSSAPPHAERRANAMAGTKELVRIMGRTGYRPIPEGSISSPSRSSPFRLGFLFLEQVADF